MRPSTAVLSLVTLAAGAGGGWAAYELAAGDGEPTGASGTTGTTAVVDEAPATVVPGTRLRWAPCRPPAELQGNTCVTSVVRTVVLPGPAAAAATSPAPPKAASVAPAAPSYQGDDDESDDDEADDDHEEDDEDEDEDD